MSLSAKFLGNRPVQAWAGAALLVALNVWIAHRLFAVEFLSFQSNEAVFISLARFYRDHWRDLTWFPFFNCGMPIENAYQPLLPALTGLVSGLSGWPVGRAFHVVMGAAYCLGPAALFWLVWEWSGELLVSFLAGLLFSLVSPAAMLFPPVRAISGSGWAAQRLFNIVYFGEDPHVFAITLLPVALVFLHRLVVRRDRWSFVGAVISCAALVATNAFGAAALVLGAVCTVVAVGGGADLVAAAGLVGWCLIAPWISPSLLLTIRGVALSERGQYRAGSEIGIVVVVLVFAVVWVLTRKLSPFIRFVCLFTPWMCAFPVAFYAAGLTLVPQPHRYQLELELVVCLVLAIVGSRLWRWPVAVVVLALVIHQVPGYRKFARELIRPVDITKTAEYKLVRWLDTNLPGERTMVSGDAAWLLNVYSDNPQMSGGHDESTPNFLQQVAVYQLYTGMNAGSNDADVSLLWLKAFGNNAVSMPGKDSAEVYKPYVNAAKFEGVLPVLWRNQGDTVYEVPQHSRSLFHVIPGSAVVGRAPVHGLDLEPIRPFVAALDDVDLPVITPRWDGLSRVSFAAPVAVGQVISIQMNYEPGWRAVVRGQERAVRKDGLGQMIVDPQCDGDCPVELEFRATTEMWICRVFSGCASLLLLGLVIRRPRR